MILTKNLMDAHG